MVKCELWPLAHAVFSATSYLQISSFLRFHGLVSKRYALLSTDVGV